MRVVKMAALASTVLTGKRSSSATRQFQRKSYKFSGRWVCELVFDAIYDWRSEFSHN
jgi:hypothetical protein